MTTSDHKRLQEQSVAEIRDDIRAGRYRGQTAGLASGRLQANLVILDDDYADAFRQFCQENRRPCPLVGLSGRGDPTMPMLGDIDIRTDIPSYNIYRDGALTDTVHDIKDLWSENMMAFALGCSFTFERALSAAGIRMRHVEANRIVPMYRTNLPLRPVGRFHGTMVVSMRPIARRQVAQAIDITARYPHAHGAPVHVGDGGAIGIGDLDTPDWGERATFEPDDVAVFWACGVTPQDVLRTARPPICITHKPGCMLVTDLPEDRMPHLA